jgi:cobalt/nickel transport protein
MRRRDKKFFIAGVIIAVLIAVLAPFVASSNPDGLESSSEKFDSAEGKDDPSYDSPLADYSIPGIDNDKYSGAIAIGLGTIIILLIVIGMSYAFKRNKKARYEKATLMKDKEEIKKGIK